MNENLYAAFERQFPTDRSACAIQTHDERYYSWDDLDRASARIANLFARSSLPPGSRVAVQVEKSAEAVLLYLATLRAGLIYLPLNTAYRESEIDYFLGDATPAIVVCTRANFSWISRLAFAAGAQHVYTLDEDRTGSLLDRATAMSDRFETVDRAGSDLAAILYTSGTTGRSKGAMLTNDNLASNARVLKNFWGWRADDVLLHALPLFHVHGLFVACNGALINGSKMIMLPRFDAASALACFRQATVFMGVPTYYVRLLAEPGLNREACRSMRLFISGSAPLLLETFNLFADRTGHTILERYGMSETLMLTSNPLAGPRVGGTVGVPLPGVSVRIVDDAMNQCAPGAVGHIQVKGPNVFCGYWNMPEKTREEFTADGYFKTGDLGIWGAEGSSSEGYISIVGRSKDLIITGGYNVYPKEIESILDELPGVVESAVFGVVHPDFGEAVCAVVVGKKGAILDEQSLITTLKQKIANYKIPKRIHVVAELPRNTMGKVQKNILRSNYAL